MNQPTPKPLPANTLATAGPGHLDMVFERIDQAIGIATAVHSAIRNSDGDDIQAGAEQACLGQIRLLEEAGEHLGQYQLDRAAMWQKMNQQRPAAPPAEDDEPRQPGQTGDSDHTLAELSDATSGLRRCLGNGHDLEDGVLLAAVVGIDALVTELIEKH